MRPDRCGDVGNWIHYLTDPALLHYGSLIPDFIPISCNRPFINFFYGSFLISILSPGISTFTLISVVRSIAFLNWSGSALILSHVL